MLAVIPRKRRLQRLSATAALLQVSNQTARGQHERDGRHANCLALSVPFSPHFQDFHFVFSSRF